MYENLFEPIKIGPVEIKNRMCLAPMNHQGDRRGNPTLQSKAFYNARALGGYGLIFSGAILTNREAYQEYPMIPYFYPGSMNGDEWYDLVESIHSMQAGTKVFAQLLTSIGRQGARGINGKPGPRGPSVNSMTRKDLYDGLGKKHFNWSKYWVHDWTGHLLHSPRETTVPEIKYMVDRFVKAAEMSILAGFDGIEIHSAHGYGQALWLSSRSNQRTDDYGGSLRNRARFLLELMTKTRAAFGNTVPIDVRMSAREYKPGSLSAEDMRQIAYWCQEEGADAISFSDGSGYDHMERLFPEEENMKIIKAQGKKAKEVIKIPIITAGIHDPKNCSELVASGETDMIAHGRQAMADPAWPNKVKEGKIDEIVRCAHCGFCTGMGHIGAQVSCRCTVNPNYQKEQYMPELWPRPMKGRVQESLKRWKPGDRWQGKFSPWNDYYNNGLDKE